MGITIIDKTKPPSPIYVRTPIPTFRSELEKQRYFAENKRRCLEGYNGLPGTLYDYLQNQYLKHRVIPKGHNSVEPPDPHWASLMLHLEIQKTRDEKKVQGIIKARNQGISTEAGALANYFAKYYPGSNSFITSKDQGGISTMFNEKIYIPYQRIDKNLQPDELAKNNTKQRCYLRMGVSHLNTLGEEEYSYSTIECRETSDTPDSPTNFSGQGAQYGYVDEAPLHKRREALFNSFIECFKDPQTKELEGFLLWGGTVESVMSNEAVNELKKMIDDKELWDCNVLFIPYWWSMFLTNGHPDQKRAEEWWDKEANKIANNPTKLRAFKMNNPRFIEDIFENAGGGRWEDDTLEVLKMQRTEVLNADVSCPKYHFLNLKDVVTPKLSDSGKFYMLETVQPQCKYAILIDGINKGTDVGNTEGSKVASLVVKTLDPKGTQYLTVNIYCERPKTTEHAHYNILNQLLYYNQFGGVEIIQMEANAGIDSFWTFMTKHGYHKLIGRAKDLSGKGWTNKNNLGQQRTPNIIKFQYEQGNIFIRKYPQSLQMMILIDELLTPNSVDSHITDAWLQFFCAYPNFDEKPKPKPLPQQKKGVRLVNKNGFNVLEEYTY